MLSRYVAAAILAAVEGGILPPGMAILNAELTAKPTRESTGQDARLYGRQDACRYGKHVRRRLVGRAFLRFLCRQDAGSTLALMESEAAAGPK